jgi:hypothetical protein
MLRLCGDFSALLILAPHQRGDFETTTWSASGLRDRRDLAQI